MNLSGNAYLAFATHFRAPPDHTLVVFDTTSLPFGTLRLRPDGSAGGHNGIGHIIEKVGHSRIPQLRVGIGINEAKPRPMDHVVGHWSHAEWASLQRLLPVAAKCIYDWCRSGQTYAMDTYNKSMEDLFEAFPDLSKPGFRLYPDLYT